MESKLESPDFQLMDISEAGTTLDNISTSSASPTISNQAENENVSGEKFNGTIEMERKNMNSIQLTTGSKDSRNNLTLETNAGHHNSQKLTPVKQHPLMFDNENDEESEDSCNNTKASNFPDVVLSHKTRETTTKSSATTADLVNIRNNNGVKSKKPIYREPSPVSKIL
jgi:hypothetical protein